MCVSEKSRNFAMKIKKTVSPSGTPEKGGKLPEKQADGIDGERRRQDMKETAAKPWIADSTFKTGIKSPFPRREGGEKHSESPKLGIEKLS